MSLDQDDQNNADTVADHFMEDNWPPQNISMAVPDKSNKKKPGIIFLSSIPPGFNVSTSIAFFSFLFEIQFLIDLTRYNFYCYFI